MSVNVTRPKPVYVVDIIREIVTATNAAVIDQLQAYQPTITGINFVPGTEAEINEVLTIMSQNSLNPWPLFALLMSFREDKAPGITAKSAGIDNEVDLNIIIARRGNNTDKTPARYENNFKPVLYPIYLEFLNQLCLSPKLAMANTPDNIPHLKWDFPYYDADKGANVFNSYVDAIQLKIKVKIKVAASWKCSIS